MGPMGPHPGLNLAATVWGGAQGPPVGGPVGEKCCARAPARAQHFSLKTPLGPHGEPMGPHGAHGEPMGPHGPPMGPPWGPRSAGFCFKARTSAMFFLGGPN